MTDCAHPAQPGHIRQLAERAIAQYGIEVVSLARLKSQVFFNTTYLVKGPDHSRFVLRIHPADYEPTSATRRRARVESELWWLSRLRMDLGLPVPTPVHTLSGESVVSVAVDGAPRSRLCVLFHWMEGRFLHRGLRPSHLEQVGQLTARLHEHSMHLVVPDGFDRQRVDLTDGETEDMVVRVFTDYWSKEAAGVMRATVQKARRTQKELGSGSVTFGLIHADIHHTNYLFSAGNIRLIDFDDCGWGHYLYDLAVTILHIEDLPCSTALRARLLAGYRQIRDLAPSHEAMLDDFCMLRVVQDLTWVVQQGKPRLRNLSARIRNDLKRIERFLASRA